MDTRIRTKNVYVYQGSSPNIFDTTLNEMITNFKTNIMGGGFVWERRTQRSHLSATLFMIGTECPKCTYIIFSEKSRQQGVYGRVDIILLIFKSIKTKLKLKKQKNACFNYFSKLTITIF